MYTIFQTDIVPHTAFVFPHYALTTTLEGYAQGDELRLEIAHPPVDFYRALAECAEKFKEHTVVISRNRNIVVDVSLFQRIAAGLLRLETECPLYVLASGGGLAWDGAVLCSHYSSTEPTLRVEQSIRPIVDSMHELYAVRASALSHFRDSMPSDPDDGFELGLVVHGYTKQHACSVYVPELCAAVNGSFASRDIARNAEYMSDLLSNANIRATSLRTLSGELSVSVRSNDAQLDPVGRQRGKVGVDELVRKTIVTMCRPLSVSIVVRTTYSRAHLLRRLLVSISRAQYDGVKVEVLLCTDKDPEVYGDEFARLGKEFPGLTLVDVNSRGSGKASRLANLVGGLKAMQNDYAWIIDDDDYLDIMSFRHLAPYLFLDDQPLIFVTTQTHRETWEVGDGRYPVIQSSHPSTVLECTAWRRIFNGTNTVPICGALLPRGVVADCLEQFDFRYDLSEDYALYLVALTLPNRPAVREVTEALVHVSIRDGSDNVINLPDRRRWVRDITGYHYDLFHSKEFFPAGRWRADSLSVAPPPDSGKDIAALQERLGAAVRTIRLMATEIERLRSIVDKSK